MPARREEHTKEQIRRILKKINDAWVTGHPEALEDYFHQDMVIVRPGFGARGTGRRACVESYREFISHATIHQFKESDHHIDLWGDTAVVTYRFQLEYQMAGEEHRDSGVDLFVFTREKGRWLAVWRTILPLPDRKR